ncbi:hypothetical protein ZOSMA_17G00730 [Zostera marina]|uniref:Transmembrane protein n=1 Tax=Zostera marina TaxID=29655 RepID=A0A0K9PR16_ZOSMR|nr:hypothetical protein ZOSMA_17G00730 [Zostera marina]
MHAPVSPLSPNLLLSRNEICICRPRSRSTCAVTVRSRLSSRRHRILFASGEEGNQSVESSSGNPKTKPRFYSVNEVEATEMDMVEMMLRSKDGLKISMAVLFWISLFFWASVWNDRDGTKRSRPFWFRK